MQGRVVRIDSGGALEFNAVGDRKLLLHFDASIHSLLVALNTLTGKSKGESLGSTIKKNSVTAAAEMFGFDQQSAVVRAQEGAQRALAGGFRKAVMDFLEANRVRKTRSEIHPFMYSAVAVAVYWI
jgi:hypothetical protein